MACPGESGAVYELVAKRVGRILRPPVAPQRQAAGDVLAEGSVGAPHALVHGLEGGPAVADLRDVPAHDVGAGVVDRTEPPAPPLLRGVEPGGVGAPQDVWRRRRDGAGVRRVPPCRCPARWGASRPWSRLSRNTRLRLTRWPCCRRRTRTLRWPSPWNDVAASTARIAATSVSSDAGVFGPRLALGGPWGDAVRAAVSYPVERGTR